MIVFKTNFILIIIILISSLRKLNAMLSNRTIEEVEQMRQICFQRISHIFTDDDIREHGKIAIDYISRRTTKSCYIFLHQMYDDGDIFAYYSSLYRYLLSDNIPSLENVCLTYSEINQDLCQYMLTRIYGSYPFQALTRAFFQLRRDILGELFARYKEELITRFPENKDNIEQFPNVAVHYWNLIIDNFTIDNGQRLCYERINSVFQGDDVREHAIHAIQNCVGNQKMDEDFYAYYSSLEQNTDKSSVPAIQDFCRNYEEINQEICKNFVARIFGTDARQALSMAFYFYRRDNIDSIYEKYKIELFQRVSLSADNFKNFPNLMMDFLNLILQKLVINTGEHAMLPPQAFCEKKYRLSGYD